MIREPSGDETTPLIRFGSVVEIDLAKARCRIRYGDPDSEDEAETDWIRWLAPRAGDVRIWCAPSLGEQVLLLCPDGQIGAAVALPGLWCDAFPPPANAEADVFAWHDGARISYDLENSELVINLPAGATVQITSPGGLAIDAEGGITLRGDVTIEGNLNVSEQIEAQGDVLGDGISLSGHRHSGVQSGGAQTGEPV